MDITQLPTPLTRTEVYLSYLAGAPGLTFENLPSITEFPTRTDVLLYYLCEHGLGGLTIDKNHIFATTADRDTYFTAHLTELQTMLYCIVDGSLYKWTDIASPATYDNTKWTEDTVAIKGEKGDQGIQGIQGYSDYDLAKQAGFTGTLSDWLASLDSCLGKYDNLAALNTAYPPKDDGIYPKGVNSHKFALVVDISGTGLVSIAFYSTTMKAWELTKLNQAIPVGTSGDAIGFSGNTSTRIALLNNADWNSKEFLYFDNQLHALMLYKPSCGFLQYSGQVVGTIAPQGPTDGQVWIGTERVYIWDDTNKFWKMVISGYLDLYQVAQNEHVDVPINGAVYRYSRDSNDVYTLKIVQVEGMDTIIWVLDDGAEENHILDINEEVVIIPDINAGEVYDLTVYLKYDGSGISSEFVRLGDTLFVRKYTKLLTGDASYLTMSTSERLLYLKRLDTNKKYIRDLTLDIDIVYKPNSDPALQGVYYRDIGQVENGTFPANPVNGQTFTGSTGTLYTYDIGNNYWHCAVAPGIPTQTGNANKLLTTDGTNASWLAGILANATSIYPASGSITSGIQSKPWFNTYTKNIDSGDGNHLYLNTRAGNGYLTSGVGATQYYWDNTTLSPYSTGKNSGTVSYPWSTTYSNKVSAGTGNALYLNSSLLTGFLTSNDVNRVSWSDTGLFAMNTGMLLGAPTIPWATTYSNTISSGNNVDINIKSNNSGGWFWVGDTSIGGFVNAGMFTRTKNYGTTLFDTTNIPLNTQRALKMPNEDGTVSLVEDKAYASINKDYSTSQTYNTSWTDVSLEGMVGEYYNVSRPSATVPFKVAKAGAYLINASVHGDGFGASGDIFLGRVVKNGTTAITSTMRVWGDADHCISINQIVALAAGDELKIQVMGGTSTGGITGATFAITKVS